MGDLDCDVNLVLVGSITRDECWDRSNSVNAIQNQKHDLSVQLKMIIIVYANRSGDICRTMLPAYSSCISHE